MDVVGQDMDVLNGNPMAGATDANTGLWVFGYGSLCWQPGFEFQTAVTGYVRGYSRKFWQGNTTHRGTKDKPGRVATLVEDKQSIVWGVAYEIKGDAALPYLNTRECALGGYLARLTTFYPRTGTLLKPLPALLYIATPTNDLWMGDAPLQDIAAQIVDCRGTSGHNVEYLIRLASFMRDAIPEADDEHLFTLESLVRLRVRELDLNVDVLVGAPTPQRRLSQEHRPLQDQAANLPAPPDTFQFTAHVPEKTLRCLNM